VPATPGSLNNQLQSNQNQQTGANGANAASSTQPSIMGTGNPALSGSGRDAATRANNVQCANILAHRSDYKADQVISCERSSANDPAGATDRRLQSENSKAVNSICRGC
jgi:hypothetical protein